MILKDNREQERQTELKSNEELELLRRFSGKLLSEYEILGVLSFSHDKRFCLNKDDESDALPVFTVHGDDYKNANISTGNCMGVIRLRNNNASVALSIQSRFDDGQKQFFLSYMLSRIFGGCIVDKVDLGNDSLWNMLLAFIFRHRLREACKIGLFRQYQKVEHNNLRFRGKLNLDAHLQRNIPFCGKLAYTTHDMAFDNPVNHLIRHAMLKIERKWKSILSGDKELTDFRHQLEQNMPSWQAGWLLPCIRSNMRPVKHPYYHGYYEPLRKISLAILRDEGASLYGESNEAEGVLFDGSWLWENYLWTLLNKIEGFDHPDNKARTRGWESPLNGYKSLYPDFCHMVKKIVLDAKYKSGYRQESDITQLLVYMFVLEAKHGGLIKPGELNQSFTALGAPEKIRRQGANSSDAFWHDISLGVPAKNDSKDFIRDMETRENKLLEYIINI